MRNNKGPVQKRSKVFSRRAVVLASIKSTLLATLVGRLYYLQIMKNDEFQTFSDSNRIKLFLIPPLRGHILDRDGRILASNKNYYRVLYDPEASSKNKHLTLARVADLLEIGEEGYFNLLKKVKKHNSRNALILSEHLSWHDVVGIEGNTTDLPGISIDVGQIRYFPLGNISSHIIGYLGPVSQEEIEKNPLLNHPDFKIGRNGSEKAFEDILRGKAGVKRMEVNAHGLTVRELSREESVPGTDLTLAIDKRMQEFATNRLEGEVGSVVIVEIKTGEVVTMVSTPGYDPNEVTYGLSSGKWRDLITNHEKPLINKSISSQYPPGSTFKLAVALAALKDGASPEAVYYCPGFMQLGNHRFSCWKKEGHGNLNMRGAIKNSCNVYFFTLAKKIGVDRIAEMSLKVGYGKDLDIGLDGEKNGLIPTEAWKEKKYKESWQMGDTLNVGIGQGYVLATPLQLAVMAARIASGRKVMPHLQLKPDAEPFEKLDIPEEHLKVVRDGMFMVTNEQGGTAYRSRTEIPEFILSGKTGTSQVISHKGLASLDNLSAAEKKRMENHAIFVGFAPFENPKYAISVFIEHGGAGSAAAAPVGRDVMKELYRLLVKKEEQV